MFAKKLVPVLILALAGVGVALAADEHAHPDADAQMAAWMKYANPGAHHEFLKRLEGTWKSKSTMWMTPGAEPAVGEGVTRNELILGGRFLQSRFEGMFMGEKFVGMALDGFDNLKNKYVGTWVDTMGTMILAFEGSVDDGGKVRTMVSEYTDAMTGKPTKMKGVTTIVSEREHKWEGYNQGPDGGFFKSMEIVYTRQ